MNNAKEDALGQFATRYGPWALVTGASSGIGEAFARQLSQKGVHVVLVARREERLNTLADALRTDGVEALPVTADLATDEGLADVVTACEGLDLGLLVLNAGFGLKGAFCDIALEQQRNMVKVNCLATLELVHRLGVPMRERKRGGIVITSSTAAWQGTPWSAAYAASKSFGLLLAEGLAVELKEHGIDVLALCPGATDTEGPKRTGVDPDRVPGPIMSPANVAACALLALGRAHVVVPGWHNRLGTMLLRAVPRKMASVLAGRTMRRVTGGARTASRP